MVDLLFLFFTVKYYDGNNAILFRFEEIPTHNPSEEETR